MVSRAQKLLLLYKSIHTTQNTSTSSQDPELDHEERSSMVVSRYHQSGYTHDLFHAQKLTS